MFIITLQQSWADKMINRIRNVIKRDCKKTKRAVQEPDIQPDAKRRKKGFDLLRRYPVNSGGSACVAEDAASLEEHKKVIATELGKARPRDSVLLPLMKSTYGERRIYILNEATSVAVILTNHPALSRTTIVSLFPNLLNSIL